MERYRHSGIKIALFILPAILIYALFLVNPVIRAFYLSLHKWNGVANKAMVFVGLKNFGYIFTDSTFWLALKNLLLFIVLNIVIQVPVGLLLAYVLSFGLKGSRIFKVAFFIPIILSATSISLMWRFILYPDTGLFDTILKSIGAEGLIHTWLADPKTAIYTLILVGCWQNVGVIMVLFLSAIVSIPDSIFESADLDGAGSFRKLLSITIPMIWEAMKINVVFLIISSIKVFDIIYIMTRGGPNNITDVPATLMVKEAFENAQYGTSSAIAAFIFIFAFAVTAFANKVMHKETIEL